MTSTPPPAQLSPEEQRRRVADAVVSRRRQLDIPQVTLAVLSGVSRGTCRNIETGGATPGRHTRTAIERWLGWAPGSVRRIENGGAAVSAIPATTLSPVLHRLYELVTSAPQDEVTITLVRRYEELITAVRGEGHLADSDVIDLIRALPGLVENARTEMIEGYLQGRTSTDHPQRRTRRELVEITAEAAAARLGLSGEVANLIAAGHVLDYAYITPTSGLRVCTLLIKSGDDPLTPQDREFIAGWAPEMEETDRAR